MFLTLSDKSITPGRKKNENSHRNEFITKKLHNKIHLSTYGRMLQHVLVIFIAILKEYWYEKELNFKF